MAAGEAAYPEVLGASGGQVLPAGREVTVTVPASTANLGPGFDTLGMALGLHDTIRARTTDGGLVLRVSGEGESSVPLDSSHLVYKALEGGLRAAGIGVRGLEIECENTIPHSRGLGSSASAAVGGLVAANALADNALDDAQLVQLSSEFEGHPDNAAAAVLGGAVVAWIESGSGHSPRYRAVRVETSPELRTTVFVPEFSSSTAETRGLLPAQVPHADAAFNASRAALMTIALGRPEFLLAATQDRLHQGYRAPALEKTTELIELLRGRGFAATVSGAGPTTLCMYTGELPQDLRSEAESRGWTLLDLPVAEGAGAK